MDPKSRESQARFRCPAAGTVRTRT
nr:hypothetical protein [Nocardia pseudovaccinii]